MLDWNRSAMNRLAIAYGVRRQWQSGGASPGSLPVVQEEGRSAFWMLLTGAIILRCLAEEAANLGGIRGSLVHRIGGGDRRHLRRTVTLSSAIAWCQGPQLPTFSSIRTSPVGTRRWQPSPPTYPQPVWMIHRASDPAVGNPHDGINGEATSFAGGRLRRTAASA